MARMYSGTKAGKWGKRTKLENIYYTVAFPSAFGKTSAFCVCSKSKKFVMKFP